LTKCQGIQRDDYLALSSFQLSLLLIFGGRIPIEHLGCINTAELKVYFPSFSSLLLPLLSPLYLSPLYLSPLYLSPLYLFPLYLFLFIFLSLSSLFIFLSLSLYLSLFISLYLSLFPHSHSLHTANTYLHTHSNCRNLNFSIHYSQKIHLRQQKFFLHSLLSPTLQMYFS
jgi:hypothetical protein